MLSIKAFKKGMVCKKFLYKIGKTYSMPIKSVKICYSGFHSTLHPDVSETTHYYILDSEYAIVDNRVVEKFYDKVSGYKIKVLCKLKTLDEKLAWDRTGEWSRKYLFFHKNNSKNSIKKVLFDIIRKDKTGMRSYQIAQYYYHFIQIKGPFNLIEILQNAVIKKDRTGKWCYQFAHEIPESDIEKLQNAVIEKDRTGKWCEKFAKHVIGSDTEKLMDIVKRLTLEKKEVLRREYGSKRK